MRNNLIIRNFGDAVFVFDPVSQSPLFVEGTLANLVPIFLENQDQPIAENLFSEIPYSYQAQARKDAELVREATRGFLAKRHNVVLSAPTSNLPVASEESPMKKLTAYAVKNWRVVNVSLEITYCCNLKCQWCYLGKTTNGILKRHDLQIITSQLREAGVVFVLFTGGETFSRKDVFDIMNDFADCGFALEAKSNGLLLTQPNISTGWQN